MHIVVGIDVGTQSTKVIAYDAENRQLLATTSHPHQIIQRDDGTSEQEAVWYIDAIRSCFAQLSEEIKSKVVAIGVSGQQHGFVPVGRDGEVLAPVKLWNDTATGPQCDALTQRLGGEEAVFDLLGNQILPGYTLPKILHLKENRTQAYEKLAHILLPHDYVNYYLSGEFWAEYGDASGTAFFDVRSKTWSEEALRAVDEKRNLLGMLPPLLEAQSIGGRVSKRAAQELGIPEGIPVSTGGGDNMAAAIGVGCVSKGDLVMSMGTSGTLFGYSDQVIADRAGRLAAFCSSTGGYLPLLCTMNCTITTEAIRALFGYDVKELDREAEKAPIGCEGITMLPYFTGERVPNLPGGKGVIAGMDMTNMKVSNIARSALESSVYALRGGLDAFVELGFEPKRIILTGGGAKSRPWRQIACDVMGLNLVVPAVGESAAFGAALQALWALEGGDISAITAEHVLFDSEKNHTPDKGASSAYDEAYRRYQRYVEAMTPLFK
ncbi:MAG: xylulokinase [Spirochaetales bacterium]|nr:xylulokinase [Spirochaetales bacterium]